MPFVTALALAAALAGCGAQAAEREAGGPRQPNIVLVLAEDRKSVV